MRPRPALLAGLLAAGALCQSAGPQVDWSAAAHLGHQAYRSDSLSAETLAWTVELDAGGRVAGSLRGRLRLDAGEDLYDRQLGLRLGLRGGDHERGGELELSLRHRRPGELSLPLLRFDPEAMLLIEEREQASTTLGTAARCSWLAGALDLHGDLEYRQRRHPDPDSLISDRRELELETEAAVYLPADLLLELRLELGDDRYRQRPASDRRRAALQLRLGRFLGERWSLRALAGGEGQFVGGVRRVNSYERPGGHLWSLGLDADRYGARSDLGLRAEYQREDWDAYDGYYRPGAGGQAELFLSRRLAAGTRADLLLAFSAFDPDSAVAEAWTLDRSRERRLEGAAGLALLQDGPWPLELSFHGEESRLGEAGDDRFRLLQITLVASWRPGPLRELRVRLSLDEYMSRYGDEEEHRDLGLGASLDFRRSLRPGTDLRLGASRNRRYSFLENEVIEDWELSVGLELE